MTTKFLQSALSKNHTRPELMELHGNIAADGYRLHRDNSLPAVSDDFTERVTCLIPTQPRNRATVTKQDLITACRRALALRDEWDRNHHNAPNLYFCMNGSLSYRAKNESTGTISAEIIDGTRVTTRIKTLKNGLKYEGYTMTYKHAGDKTVEFGLNPNYLLDALAGMEGDTVDIDISAHAAPFYMTDGTREAVIMPVS